MKAPLSGRLKLFMFVVGLIAINTAALYILANLIGKQCGEAAPRKEFLGFKSVDVERAIKPIASIDTPRGVNQYKGFLAEYETFMNSFTYIEDDSDEIHKGEDIIRRNYGDCLDIAIASATIAQKHGIEAILVFGENITEAEGHVWAGLSVPQGREGIFQNKEAFTIVRDSKGFFVFLNPSRVLKEYSVMAYFMRGDFFLTDNGAL
jgi:hypothetical protein